MFDQSSSGTARSRTRADAGRQGGDLRVQSMEPMGGTRTHSRPGSASADSRSSSGVTGASERLVQVVVVRAGSRTFRLLRPRLCYNALVKALVVHGSGGRSLVAGVWGRIRRVSCKTCRRHTVGRSGLEAGTRPFAPGKRGDRAWCHALQTQTEI